MVVSLLNLLHEFDVHSVLFVKLKPGFLSCVFDIAVGIGSGLRRESCL